MVVCRPPIAHDIHRLGGDASAASGTPAELDILPAEDAPADAPDADLLRYIAVGKDRDHAVRLPVYGYRGGADGAALCEREVAPLLARLLAGESSAIIAYGQTGQRQGCLNRVSAARAVQHSWVLERYPNPQAAVQGVAFPAAAQCLPSLHARLPSKPAGSGKSYTMGTEQYGKGQGPASHSGAVGRGRRAG